MNSDLARRGRKGFTVLELLIASAVTMVIAVIMVSLISSILTSWTRLSGSLTTGSQARLALEVMAEDLQSSFFENDGNVWLAASVLHGGDAVDPARGWVRGVSLSTERPMEEGEDFLDLLPELDVNNNQPFDPAVMPWRYGTGGTWLRFFTAGPDPSGPQVPRAVSYQIVRRPVTTAPEAEVRYILYRSVVNQENTLAMGYHLGSDETSMTRYEIFPNTPYYQSSSAAFPNGNPEFGAPEVIRRPRPDHVIANDVIDFGVRFYTRDPNGSLVREFPLVRTPNAKSGGRASESGRHYFAGEVKSDGELVPFPDVIEVFLRVLTPEGARLIQNFENQRTPPVGQTWWGIAEANSEVYSRRIHLR